MEIGNLTDVSIESKKQKRQAFQDRDFNWNLFCFFFTVKGGLIMLTWPTEIPWYHASMWVVLLPLPTLAQVTPYVNLTPIPYFIYLKFELYKWLAPFVAVIITLIKFGTYLKI